MTEFDRLKAQKDAIIEDETHAWEYWHQRCLKAEAECFELRAKLSKAIDELSYADLRASGGLAGSP